LARLTRKELKSDKFAVEVQHSVEYVAEHRRQMTIYAIAIVAVVIIGAAWYAYSHYQHGVREQKLAEAVRIQNSSVGPSSGTPFILTFPTQEAKDKALNAALTELVTKYHGSEEGTVAEYLMGTAAADNGKLDEADRRLRDAVDNGAGPYTALAKVALARVLGAENKTSEGAALLRSLMEKPTAFVSKEEATLDLAELLKTSNPDEARKLLGPLRAGRSAVSKIAITQMSEIPAK
jgi:predicted negative regulator of RcsB-dependent stress response